jgi:hypothetical protein
MMLSPSWATRNRAWLLQQNPYHSDLMNIEFINNWEGIQEKFAPNGRGFAIA